MLLVFPIGRWIFSFVPMLHSRQPQRLSLFGLLLALSLVHVSLPAQAGESGSETAVLGFDLAAAPLSLAVVLPVWVTLTVTVAWAPLAILPRLQPMGSVPPQEP
jgi:hypothetical protein